MDRVMQPAVALRLQRDDDDLPGDGDERQPRDAKAHVGKSAQAPAREGHRGQAEQQNEADEHLARWDRPAVGRLKGAAERSSTSVDG
jgi:hypothetical protein